MNPEQCLEHIKTFSNSQAEKREELIEIYEGGLSDSIEKRIKDDFSANACYHIMSRLAPINLLQKLVDKLSTIYSQNPIREIPEGSDVQKELLSWYEEKLDVNYAMNHANEFFNMFKSCLIQPYLDSEGQPQLRTIQNNLFIPVSTDRNNDLKMTDLIIFYGKDDRGKNIYIHYDNYNFYYFDQDKNIRDDFMPENNQEGFNDYGRIPFIYVNRSKNKLIPKLDSDLLNMTLTLPIMLSELNYSVKFQAFSVLYMIDAEAKEFKMNPNTVLELKTPKGSDKQPQIGSIKPSVDISETLKLISSELSLWLNSKGIRPGAVTDMSAENFASGISKIIDEMDTYDERQKQGDIFSKAEGELWDLIINRMHPVWVRQNRIENKQLVDADTRVITTFTNRQSIPDRGKLVTDLKAELEAGFTTKKRVLKKLNPGMSGDEIDALIAEIESEKADKNGEGTPPEASN